MKTNQHKQIIEYLEEHGKITRFTATLKLGISNLPQRIRELKLNGVQIGDRTLQHINRNGNKTRYKEYYLKKDTSAIEKQLQEQKTVSAKQELINTIAKTKLSKKQINILIEFINQIKNQKESNLK